MFQLEGILIEKNLIGILYNCFQRMQETLSKGLEKENLEEFINEFNSYIILFPNVKFVKLLEDIPNEVKHIKCAIAYKEKKMKNRIKKIESDKILASYNESDFTIYKRKITIYNGISIYLESEEFIYPPDWRKEIDVQYVNELLDKCISYKKVIKEYLEKKSKYKFLIFKIKQPNGKITNFGIQIINYIFDIEENMFLKGTKFNPLSVYSITPKNLCLRGGGNTELNSKKILIIGCGSIGGYLIEQIAKSGINNIEVIDDDTLTEENIYRNILGMEYIGRYKSEAICEHIKRNIPNINIIGMQMTIEEALEDDVIDLNNYDLVISAVGNHNVNRWLNDYIYKKDLKNTMMYVWNEVLDIGNHILVVNKKYTGCYECLFELDKKDELFDRSSYCEKGQTFTKQMQGCGTEYLPYSSSHSLRIVTYAVELVKELFNRKIDNNILFSLKGTDYYIKKLGYKTSKRYDKQDSVIKELMGEEFKNCECEVCGKSG